MFDIQELRYLLSLDEFRHFKRAASAVGISQPALTKTLQRIERQLGAKLFERSRAGVMPTEIGREFLLRAKELVEDANRLRQVVGKMKGNLKESVSIGVGPAMSETPIAEAISLMTQKFPQTQVVIRVDHWQQLSEWLLDGRIDFYVADIRQAKVDSRFVYSDLPAQNFVWFCRKAHPLTRLKAKRIVREQLMKYPIATPTMPPWALEWFAEAYGVDGVANLPEPFPTVECESYSILKKIVSTSDCISAALQQTISNSVDQKRFRILPVDAPVMQTNAGIVRLSERRLSPQAEFLAQCVRKLLHELHDQIGERA